MATTDNKEPLKRFWKLVNLEKGEIFTIYFYAVLSGLIYLSLPLGVQAIINLLFGGLVSTSMVVLVFVVVFGVFANGWLQIKQMKVNERIQRRIFTRYSLQFAYKIPRLDLMAVDDYYLPELVNRFFDTASLQKGFSKMLIEFPSATVQIFFGLLLLSFYNSAFIFFGIGLIALIVLIFRLTYKRGISTSLEESNYKYEVGNWLEEVARTIKTFKFMGVTEYPSKRADSMVSNYLDAREEHFEILKIQYWSFVFFKVIITAALLIIGSFLVIEQQINIGQFIAAEIVIITLLNSVEKLISSLDVVYDMLTSLEKVSKLLEKPEERQGTLDIAESIEKHGIKIEAHNLTYRFSGHKKKVLSDLNFEIQAGEKVCIFGTQGSGKTTLLKVLTGAFPNYEGKLLFNNYPLGDYDLIALRQQIGVYLASPDLFSGTLRENLTLGNDSITTDNILQIAGEVGLLNYIQSLGDGLHSSIDTIGKNLPRNTITKILLARALLTQPRLLLIEDCWSSLEIQEQEHIIEYLTLNQPFTLISVTNDEAFAQKCDRIILLSEGKIVSQGSFEQVRQTVEYKRVFKRLSL
jgi:ATP-binding cassette subfamily B protein